MTTMQKHPYKIDVPVLLIFFNRPGCFAQVFEQVKKARPSKLFLYQDGAREGNEKDVIGVQKCREIALNIDWECELHTLFQEKNYGCDPSGYLARKWAFESVDKCIILEDDCVPSQSFFPFCKELLDRYETDQRINMICGMNNLETADCPYSYLFTETGSICGLATWKRAFNNWESDYAFLDDTYSLEKMKLYMNTWGISSKARIKTWNANKASGVQHHETLNGGSQVANHQLNIVSTYNQITNVGNTPEGGTHSVSNLRLMPKGLRRIFTMNRYEIEFPLKHPKYMINDVQFQKDLFRVMGTGHPWVKFYRNIEKTLLLLRYEGFGTLFQKIKRKLGK